jgi:hypothetical protein
MHLHFEYVPLLFIARLPMSNQPPKRFYSKFLRSLTWILCLLFVYALCRMGFICKSSEVLHLRSSFNLYVHGFRYDLSAILLVNGFLLLLYWLPIVYETFYQKFWFGLATVLNATCIVLNWADSIYSLCAEENSDQ